MAPSSGKERMQAIAAIHGFDARAGAQRQCGLLLSPLGFKGRTFIQAPGFDLPPHEFGVVGFGCRGGCFYSFHLRECCSELSLREIAGQDRLLQRRAGNIVCPGYGVDLVLDCGGRGGKRRGGIGPCMGQDHAAIRVVALPLEGRSRGVGPIGTTLVDRADVGCGNGVGLLRHVAPALTERRATGERSHRRHHVGDGPGEIRVPVARGVEQVGGHGDQIGDGVRNRADLSKSGFLQMFELSGELRDVAVHAQEGLSLVGNLRALIGDHHEIVNAVLCGSAPHKTRKAEGADGDEDDQCFLHWGCSFSCRQRPGAGDSRHT